MPAWTSGPRAVEHVEQQAEARKLFFGWPGLSTAWLTVTTDTHWFKAVIAMSLFVNVVLPVESALLGQL